MSSSSNVSPIEQALHLAQIQLINAKQNKNDSAMKKEDVDVTDNSKVTLPKKEISEHEIITDETKILHHDFSQHNYYIYQQPKNDIHYDDWVQLFPDLDVLHGNFRSVIIEEETKCNLKHGETTKQEEDKIVVDTGITNDNKFQITNELAEIMECRNKLKKFIIETKVQR